MSGKRITCTYINSEDIIKEYISTTNKQNDKPIIGVMVVALIFGIYGFVFNPGSTLNFLWVGIAIYIGFSEIYSSRAMIAKRQAKRYKSRYGRVETKIKIILSDKVYFSIDGQSREYKWLSIVRISETDTLLIISYPNEMIPLKKDCIKNATLEEAREFLRDHIAEAKLDKKKEKEHKKEFRKMVRNEQKNKFMKRWKR